MTIPHDGAQTLTRNVGRLPGERPVRDAARPPESDRLGPRALVPLRSGCVGRHSVVLTLGYSCRSFYLPCRDEQLHAFVDAHERAFESFGGHTTEYLYDRQRTNCRPGDGGVIWHPTFQAFAPYWGFDPRLCHPYRVQTEGNFESGVKYVKRNFLVGRDFVDGFLLGEDLLTWMTSNADRRIHRTTHERPTEPFTTERTHLLATAHHPTFRLPR